MISDLILDGSFSQYLKALSPIFVTPLGILILVSELHPQKALSPIFVTPLGILILVSELQILNLLLVDYQYYTF